VVSNTQYEPLEARWSQLKEKHPYVAAFHENVPWQALPLYMGMVIVFTWLVTLTLTIASNHTPSADMTMIVRITKYTIYLFVAIPFLYGFTGVVAEYLRRRAVA
jgi:hypothetical protein